MATIQIVDNLALIPLTASEVASFNLAALGVITIQSSGSGGGGAGDMLSSVFATINPGAGYVDKALSAAQVPYTGLSSLPGGTSLFLRSDGTFATPPGQIYNNVSIASAGLVPILPGSSGFLSFLRGDGGWQPINSLSIGYSQLTSIPASFPAQPHQSTHITGGVGGDIILPASTTRSGLVPILPVAGLQSTSFLRGDSTWTVIPQATASTPGLAPALGGNTLFFLRGDGSFSQPVYGSLLSIPPSFTPSTHATTHITFGQDLIPNFSIGGSLPGLVPASPGGGASYLRADGTWNIPPGGGGLASPGTAGLMNSLPLTAGSTYYWGGDNNPHLISGLSLAYSQITPGTVPIFAGSSAGLVPNSSGGTFSFLRADGVYAVPPGTAVTTSQIGAVAQLPASSGASYYLNGSDSWTLLSTLTILWTQITPGSIPTQFNPLPHASTHVTPGGSDAIGPATGSRNGLVPILPALNPTLNFLRGDSFWAPIPIAAGASGGLVPTPPNIQNQWFRGDAQFAVIPGASTGSAGLLPPYPGNTTTFLNGSAQYTQVDYVTAVTNKPPFFAPTPHAAQHVTGGGDLIALFSGSSTGLVPIGGAVGTYLNSAGGWTTPSGSGDVLHTRQILTDNQSLTGGGDLSADRTIVLVGDVTTPAASFYYGTNSSGTRGWFAGTSFPVATGSTAGLVPGTGGGSTSIFLTGTGSFGTPPTFTATTPGYAPLSGGNASNFLCANGTWTAPPTAALATVSAGGIVPNLQTALVQANYYLRGDDSWQLISGLPISFSQLSGVPTFTGTTTPGLVPGNSGGNQAFFLRGDGNFATPPLAASGTVGYVAGLPSSAATNFWLRGDNSWQLPPNSIIVSSPFTMPAIGTAVPNVPVSSTVILDLGMTLFMGVAGANSTTECLMEITGIGAGLVNLTNQGYAMNPASGTQIPGGPAFIVGPGVTTTSSPGYVPRPPNDATQFLNGQGQWTVPPGSGGLSTVSTQYSVSGTGSVGSPVQLLNDSPSPGPFKFYSTDANGTRGWLPLSYSWETNATFSLPGVGATVPLSLISNVGVTIGSTIVVEDNNNPPNQAFLEVTAVNVDGTHITVNNRGFAFNTAGTPLFATAAAVTLAGPGVFAGGNAGFVPHSLNDTVNFLRSDGQFQTPANVSIGVAGYVPSAPGVITQFLNGNGVFSTPTITSLATTGTDGALKGLPATNQATSVLRGDNTWVLMSTLSAQITYASIPGIPTSLAPTTHHATHISTGSDPIDLFSTAATTSGLVVGSNGVGNTFFLRADGAWATTPSGPSLATAGTDGLLKGLIASPTLQYLRGDNNWFPINGLAITYGQLTGTVPFAALSHGTTHLDVAGGGTDTIPVVQGSRTGLVPILPATAPTTKFLRGDATWTVIPNMATNAVTPGLVVGSNSAANTNFLRADNTWQGIQAVSTTLSGIVPPLPATNGTSNWLRGDASWVNIPFYWTVQTSFAQPSISSSIVVTFVSTVGMQVGMCIATVDTGSPPVTNFYTISAINVDGVHATLINIGVTGNTAAVSTVFAGQASLAGPPIMGVTNSSGLVPISTGNATQFLCANGSWAAPSTTGVPLTRNINTQYSLAGGGQLNGDLTLNLAFDIPTPGPWSVYGTNGTGTPSRAWQLLSAYPVSTTTAAGLLPMLPTISPTTVFLRGDGTFVAPAGLALASGTAAGIVPQLPAVPPATPTQAQWLRADNSWQFLPDSNVTTASWQMPAVGSTVPSVQFNATTNWDVGMTLFFATGDFATCCYMEVISVNNGLAQLTLSNRGYTSNPIVNTTIPTCMVFVVSPGIANVSGGVGFTGLVPKPDNNQAHFLRGDASFQVVPTFNGLVAGMVPNISSNSTLTFLRGDGSFATPPGGLSTTVGGSFTWPANNVDSPSILVGDSTIMIVGSAVYVVGFGTGEVRSKADGTHVVLRNTGNVGNLTSGTVGVSTGIFVGTAGAKATATASGMIPIPPNDTTKVLLGDATFGTLLYSSLGSIPGAPLFHAPTHLDNGTDPIAVVAGSRTGLVPVLPATNPTNKWLRGDATWVQGPPICISTASFTWPGVAGTVVVTVDSSSLLFKNMGLYAPGLGVCEITNISGTSVTIRNNGNTNNAGSTAGQTPAFYAAGVGGLATATTTGMIPLPPNNTTTFLRGDASFATPPSATATVAGYVPTPPNNTTTFLRGDATFTTPPAATATVTGYVPTPPNNTYQFLNGQAAFVTPLLTYARFKPYDNIPFGTTYPAFNTRGSYGLPVLDCPDAATTDCLFSDIMPQNANLGSGLTVLIKFTAHTATSGNVRWQVAFGRLNSSIATATFDTAGLVTQATNGTIDSIATATVSALTTINGITAGDLYVCKVSRLGNDGADSMTDTAQLCSVEIRSAGT